MKPEHRLFCSKCGDERALDGDTLSSMTIPLPALWSGWFLFYSDLKGSGVPRVFAVCHGCLFESEQRAEERRELRKLIREGAATT